MKHIATKLLLGSLFFCFFCTNSSSQEPCIEGLDLKPMYGRVKKCKEQINADTEFIAMIDKVEPDRKKAAIMTMEAGLTYVEMGDYDIAMQKINQAWLLDKNNIRIYASFLYLLDLTEKENETRRMMDLTLSKLSKRKPPLKPTKANPSNETIMQTIVNNTLKAFEETGNPMVGEYLYHNIDIIELPLIKKNTLKYMLKSNIPSLNR